MEGGTAPRMPDARPPLEQGRTPLLTPEDRTRDVQWQATPVRRGYSLAIHQQIVRNGDTGSASLGRLPAACHLRPGRCRGTLGSATSLFTAGIAHACPGVGAAPKGRWASSRD